MSSLLPLTKGKSTIIDDENFEYLNQWKWHFAANRYAARKMGEKKIYMHREIMKANDQWIDHINGNGLDNRKCNLRFCSPSENHWNTGPWKKRSKKHSVYKGVSWSNKMKKWNAYIRLNGKNKYLGSFISESDAAKAYNKIAEKISEDFAFINKI